MCDQPTAKAGIMILALVFMHSCGSPVYSAQAAISFLFIWDLTLQPKSSLESYLESEKASAQPDLVSS